MLLNCSLIALFLQLLLIDKKFQEVNQLLAQAGHLVDTWTGSQHQKEYLKVFFLVLQVRLRQIFN